MAKKSIGGKTSGKGAAGGKGSSYPRSSRKVSAARKPAASIEDRGAKFRESFLKLREEVGKVIVGQRELVEQVLIALFSGGHVLLEGVPGLGKTMLVRTLSDALSLSFSRIQFTPDLMPADIVGTDMVFEDSKGRKSFRFEEGPIFANIILADEINRATPKTQSALLEAMQERSVTVGGQRHKLDEPFFVLATQNPIEMEGTYPLPEAQLDRFFFKLKVLFPSEEEAMEIMNRTTQVEAPEAKVAIKKKDIKEMMDVVREIFIAEHVQRFALRVLYATHPDNGFAPEMCKKYVRYGASPRGAQAMILAGKVLALLDDRYNVSEDDIRAVAAPSLRHRIILNFEGEAEGVDNDAIVEEILKSEGFGRG